jgi:hypothetical protein
MIEIEKRKPFRTYEVDDLLKFELKDILWNSHIKIDIKIESADLESIIAANPEWNKTIIEAYFLTSMGFDVMLSDNRYALYVHGGKMYDSNVNYIYKTWED